MRCPAEYRGIGLYKKNGYIPYINIYNDLTVIVPIETIDSDTTTKDKVYAEYKINESLFYDLKTYFDATSYTKF